MSRTAALLLAATLVTLPLAGRAEEPEPIEPDRAGAATGTRTVGAGRIQLETGLEYGHERIGGRPSERRFAVQVGVRAGLSDALELRAEGEPLVGLRGPDEDTGTGDVVLSAKWRFLDGAEGAWPPALGVLPFVKLPVAGEPIGSGKTDFGVMVLASFDLPGKVGLDLDAGLAAVGQSRPGGHLLQALLALGLSRDLVERVTAFTDVFYASRDERDGRDRVGLDAGLVWRPTPNVALDGSVVTSLAGAGPDWALRGGVSVRLGR
jgi:hypothetical protein